MVAYIDLLGANMKRHFYIFYLIFLFSCSSDKSTDNENNLKGDTTNLSNCSETPLEGPNEISFNNYHFIKSDSNGSSTLELYYFDRLIFKKTQQDGIYGRIHTAKLNKDNITDYLIEYLYEDGAELYALTSISNQDFKYKLIKDEIAETYCIAGLDTLNGLQPLIIKDINNDSIDEIIVNVILIDNNPIANSCTDTVYVK